MRDNAGAGVLLGANGALGYSCLQNNGEYGFEGRGGRPPLSSITMRVTGNNTWTTGRTGRRAADAAAAGEVLGRRRWGTVTGNYVHGNLGPGMWADTDNGASTLSATTSPNNQGEAVDLRDQLQPATGHNTFVRNALVGGAAPGRVSRFGGLHFRVRRRTAGYVADMAQPSRSPPTRSAITGAGWCYGRTPIGTAAAGRTPPAVTVRSSIPRWRPSAIAAIPASSDQRPTYNDCRWKTQNVRVRWQ